LARAQVRWAVLVLGALGATHILAFGQGREPVPPEEVQKPKEAQKEARWQVAPAQDLADLVDAASAILHIPIEYDRAAVSGPLTLRLPTPLRDEELLDLVHRNLAAKGLTTVQMPGSNGLTVVALEKAATLARLEDQSLRGARAGFVKVLIDLDHDRIEAATEAIKLVLTRAGTVTGFKDTRSLLISDLRPSVAEAVLVARHIDGPFTNLDVFEIKLQHTSPAALVALLERISQTKKAVFGEKPAGTVLAHPEGNSVLVVAPPLERDVWEDLVRRFDRADPVQTLNYSPRRFGVKETSKLVLETLGPQTSGEGWRMVSDELTGTLVITATPSQHRVVQDLFDRLEGSEKGPRRPMRSFPIKHRGVEELRDILVSMLEKGALKDLPDVRLAPTGRVVDRVPPGEEKVQGVTAPIPTLTAPRSDSTGALGDELVLTADKATNRLIALGTPRVLEQLEHLITELDVREPQVMVEALVVSLSDTQTRSLGVELQRMGSSGEVQYKLGSLFGLGNLSPTEPTIPALAGTGATGVVLDPGSFSVLVKALETVNEGRTLTIPKVLVTNQQPASLNSVLQTPFANTNASTTVATTSFGGTQDAGTEISVTPRITEGDELSLDYTITLSSFVGDAASPSLPPPRQQNKLKSTATVPDGFTVAVGGLEVETDGTSSTRVPLLGSIPILGALFSNQSRSKTKSHFYVFLRTTVLRSRSFEDLRYVSASDLAAAKLDDGWPKVQPRVIR
jgi:general secretion pathway protein D